MYLFLVFHCSQFYDFFHSRPQSSFRPNVKYLQCGGLDLHKKIKPDGIAGVVLSFLNSSLLLLLHDAKIKFNFFFLPYHDVSLFRHSPSRLWEFPFRNSPIMMKNEICWIKVTSLFCPRDKNDYRGRAQSLLAFACPPQHHSGHPEGFLLAPCPPPNPSPRAHTCIRTCGNNAHSDWVDSWMFRMTRDDYLGRG